MNDPWKDYNHESEKNLETQGTILIKLITPMSLKELIKTMLLDHRTNKTDTIRNVNYLMVRKNAVVSRKHILYLERNDPGRYVRKRERT